MSIEHVDDLRGMLDSEVVAEIAALRADRAALADRVRALEAAGERMAVTLEDVWDGSQSHAAGIKEAIDGWRALVRTGER